MSRIRVIILLLILLSLLAIYVYYQKQPCAARVIDGDTFVLTTGEHIRLTGIDTPELGSKNIPAGCFAAEAKDLLEKMILGRPLRLESDTDTRDRYGRTLAYVFARFPSGQELFINAALLERGAGPFLADVNSKRYEAELIKMAEEARTVKRGLWQKCADPELGACLVKGNLDRNDVRYYHLPSFRHYSQIMMNLDKGDRWFCHESEASSAGFRRARD